MSDLQYAKDLNARAMREAAAKVTNRNLLSNANYRSSESEGSSSPTSSVDENGPDSDYQQASVPTSSRTPPGSRNTKMPKRVKQEESSVSKFVSKVTLANFLRSGQKALKICSVQVHCDVFNISTTIMAQHFAKKHGVPFVTWDLHTIGPLVDKFETQRELLFMLESGLVGMFVEGALAYLTENADTFLDLANGSQVRLHSLSFWASDMGRVTLMKVGGYGRWTRSLPLALAIRMRRRCRSAGVQSSKEKWPADITFAPNDVVIPIGSASL